MTEQISDQISAFIDDELSDEESAFLLRRFERDTDARSRAARYTMIGAALRDELVGSDPEILRRRIAAALTGTAPAAQQRSTPRVQWRYLRPAFGVGIAAGTASGTGSVLFATVSPADSGLAPIFASSPSVLPFTFLYSASTVV